MLFGPSDGQLIKHGFILSQIKLFLNNFIIHSAQSQHPQTQSRSYEINILAYVPALKQAKLIAEVPVFFQSSAADKRQKYQCRRFFGKIIMQGFLYAFGVGPADGFKCMSYEIIMIYSRPQITPLKNRQVNLNRKPCSAGRIRSSQ